MFKWLKSLLGGEKKEEEAVNNDNSGAENAMPRSEGGQETEAAGISEAGDVSMGVASEDPQGSEEEKIEEPAQAPESPASEEGSEEEKTSM